jgi:hypothetical protein
MVVLSGHPRSGDNGSNVPIAAHCDRAGRSTVLPTPGRIRRVIMFRWSAALLDDNYGGIQQTGLHGPIYPVCSTMPGVKGALDSTRQRGRCSTFSASSTENGPRPAS